MSKLLSVSVAVAVAAALAGCASTPPEEDPVQIPDAEWLGQQLEVRRRRSTLIG